MDKKQKILFMSGFPRAGSTLLMNILNQNPRFHGTPTSGLITTVTQLRDNWRLNSIYQSNGESVYPRIKTMLKNMMIGFYEKEVLNGQIPIDKNRGWGTNIDLLEEIFDCEIKIIYPIRQIDEILVSLERVNRKSLINYHGDSTNWANQQTVVGRIHNALIAEGILGSNLRIFEEIFYRKLEDRFIFVPYNDLLVMKQEMMEKIYDELEMEPFMHDFENIKQTIFENDIFHGYAPEALHKIKEGKILEPQKIDYTYIRKSTLDGIMRENKAMVDKINRLSTIKDVI